MPDHHVPSVADLLDHNPDASFTADRNGRFTYLNAAAERLFGRPRPTLLGRSVFDELSTVLTSSVRPECERALTDRVAVSVEVRAEALGAWFAVRAWPCGYGLAVCVEDITARKRAEAEHTLATLVEASSDSIIGTTLDGVITSWNPAAERLYGWTAAEAIGQPDAIIIPPELRQARGAVLARLAAGERIDRFETVRLRKDGTRVPVSVTLAPVRDAAGRVVAVSGVAHDITARKAAEEASRRASDVQSAILDTLPAHVALLDRDGTVRAVNRAWAVVGPARAFLGSHARVGDDYLAACEAAPDDGDEGGRDVAGGIRAVLAGRWGAFEREYARRAAGSTAWFRVAASPLCEGALDGAVVMHLDVTRRRLTEEALRASERHVRLLGRAVSEAVWTWDIPTDRIVWSEAVETLFGYAAEETGQTSAWWAERIHPDDRERVTSALRTLVASGSQAAWTEEYRFARRDGSYAIVLDRGYVAHDESGRPARAIGAMLDISAQRQLEDQLRQAQKMEAVGRLAGGVAHDFNNLLTVILGHTELALASLPEGSPVRRDVVESRRAAERAAGLTRQLLAFSRKQILKTELLDPNGLVADLETMLRRLIGEPVALVTDLDSAIGLVTADRGQLEQAIVNLVVNARDAMPDGGRLTIETRSVTLDEQTARQWVGVSPGRHVRIGVRDTGVGITPEVRAHLFEPFFTTKPVGKGTGLGLATVYGIVTQSGGKVWAESEPGQGAAFFLCLPETAPPREHAAGGPGGSAAPGAETVLVAEDEPAVRDLATRMLERVGYRVLAASGGEQALTIAHAHDGPIHLLLTDVVMPDTTGPRLADAVRRIRPGIRVVFMSGYSDDALARHGVLEPGVVLLDKPFTSATLAETVRQALDDTAPLPT